MNKILKKIIQEITIQPVELTDDILENTPHFKFIIEKLTENAGVPTFKRKIAVKLIVEQLYHDDDYGYVDFSRHKEELKKLLANLNEAELSDILSYYFGGADDKRKFKLIENIEYLSSKNESIPVNFIIDVLANTIVDEINYEVLLVKLKLQKLIPNKDWYEFYEINKDDYSEEEYDYEIERIDDILEGVLK